MGVGVGKLKINLENDFSGIDKDDVGKVQIVRDYILNDMWWDNVDYILRFTEPIYEMIQVVDTYRPILQRVLGFNDRKSEERNILV